MKHFILILCALLILYLNQTHAAEPSNVLLDSLKSELIEVARPQSGIGEDGQELTKKMVKLDHEKVVEALLPLLKHKKKGVPYLASYIISDCRNGLKAENLDQLKEGYKNGGSWLPHAIGSLGTDAAIEFLIKEFRGNPKIHGQVDSALMKMDKAVIPFILKEFDNADPKSEQQFFEGLCFLFKGDICYDGLKEKA